MFPMYNTTCLNLFHSDYSMLYTRLSNRLITQPLNLPAKAIFLRIRNYIKKFPAITTGNHRLG